MTLSIVGFDDLVTSVVACGLTAVVLVAAVRCIAIRAAAVARSMILQFPIVGECLQVLRGAYSPATTSCFPAATNPYLKPALRAPSPRAEGCTS